MPPRRLPVSAELVLQRGAVDQAGQAIAIRALRQAIHQLADPQRGAEPRQQLGITGQGREHVEGAEVQRRDPLAIGRTAAVQDHGNPARRRLLAATVDQLQPAAGREVPPGQDHAGLDARHRVLGRGEVGAGVDRQAAGRQHVAEPGTLVRRGLDQEHAPRRFRRRRGDIRPVAIRLGIGIGRRSAGKRRRHGCDPRLTRSGFERLRSDQRRRTEPVAPGDRRTGGAPPAFEDAEDAHTSGWASSASSWFGGHLRRPSPEPAPTRSPCEGGRPRADAT